MAERLPSGNSTGDEGGPPGGGVGRGTPRWVKVLAIVGSVLLIVLIVLHLTGNQLGGHMPPGHQMHTSGLSSP